MSEDPSSDGKLIVHRIDFVASASPGRSSCRGRWDRNWQPLLKPNS